MHTLVSFYLRSSHIVYIARMIRGQYIFLSCIAHDEIRAENGNIVFNIQIDKAVQSSYHKQHTLKVFQKQTDFYCQF